MKKIRFANPIKECLRIQGKVYTVILIATLATATALSVVAVMALMPICAILSGIVGVGGSIFFGWWFATRYFPDEEDM